MKSKRINLRVGPLLLRYKRRTPIKSSPIGGKPKVGSAWLYELLSPEDWNITLAYVEFDHNKRDIRCLEYSETAPDVLHRLTHGLRMAVYRDVNKKKDWIELSQARLKDQIRPKWSNLRCASGAELSKGAGFDLGAKLRKMGASFGPREKIIKDNSRRRYYFCATFPYNDHRIPLIAYTATRVLALLNCSLLSD
jgi:hypothetical protein